MEAKKKKFKTEVQQLLDLVIHSLYSNRDIFLRELISNASDAIDRARFESLSAPEVLEDDPDWKIKLHVDREVRTITISDNGVGMTAEEVEKNIGTIANSGTRRFLAELQEHKGTLPPELIGQFGVGFYAAFMVADRVTVLTRRAGAADAATLWESAGSGTYTIASTTKATRGTDVTLHLKPEMDEYLDEWRIRKIVKHFSDFVEHPVTMDVRREETPTGADGKPIDGAEKTVRVDEETLNTRKAIWQRPRAEITDEEYNEFYKHISHDFQDPLECLHWNVEGGAEFRALLYIPQKAMFDLFMPEERHRGIQLYVKRVFITDHCEALLPPYLRFVRGVVDSSDLPLNISRELLQEDRQIRIIRKNVVKKVLDTLGEMRDKNRDKFVTFWREFGTVLKEGMHTDLENREKLQELLLFQSTKTEAAAWTSLAEVVARMPEAQKAIYYITGDNRQALENSPHLEALRKKDYEVLFLTDPIDEWVVQAMTAYKDKPLKSIAKGDIDLATDDEEKEQIAAAKKSEAAYDEVLSAIKAALGDKVKDVRFSRRLTESACCLVTDEHGLGLHMERLLKAMGQDMPPASRILELNAAHPLLATMQTLHERDKANPKLAEFAEMLYDQAALTAGLSIDDPLRFAQRINALMAEAGQRAE